MASVLAISAVSALAAFSMAAVVVSHLGTSNHFAYGRDASYLAEGALASVIDSIQQVNTYGTNNERIVWQPDPNDPTRTAVIDFNHQNTFGDPYSTNNMNGNSPTGFNSVSVPGGTAHILAVGTAHGQTKTVEVLLNVPQFPYVLSAAGKFDTPDALNVRGSTLANFVAEEAGQSNPTPASMASNVSVHVGGHGNITGNVVSPGTVTFDDNTSWVGGMIQSGTTVLPNITTSDYDATKFGAAIQAVNTLAGPQTMSGANYFQPPSASGAGSKGQLTISGDLTLSGALLYVDGDLMILGGLQGKGAVAVTGKTTISGGVSLASPDNLAALLCDGDVTLAGTSAGSSRPYFQGLVYTHGNFTASNIIIAGAFIMGPPSGSVGGTLSSGLGGTPVATSPNTMSLSNVDAVYLPEAGQIQVILAPGTPNKFAEGTATFGSTNNFAFGEQVQSPSDLQVFQHMSQSVGDALSHIQSPNPRLQLLVPPPLPTGTSPGTDVKIWTPDFCTVSVPVTGTAQTLQVVTLSFPLDGTTGKCAQVPASQQMVLAYLTPTSNLSLITSFPSSLSNPVSYSYFDFYSNLIYTANGPPGLSSQGYTQQEVDQLAQQAGTSLQEMISYGSSSQAAFMASVAKFFPTNASGAPGSLDLSLNQFLGTGKPIRILSWTEH